MASAMDRLPEQIIDSPRSPLPVCSDRHWSLPVPHASSSSRSLPSVGCQMQQIRRRRHHPLPSNATRAPFPLSFRHPRRRTPSPVRSESNTATAGDCHRPALLVRDKDRPQAHSPREQSRPQQSPAPPPQQNRISRQIAIDAAQQFSREGVNGRLSYHDDPYNVSNQAGSILIFLPIS